MHAVSEYRPPPFAPRIWIEGDNIVLLFRDGQAITVPRHEQARVLLFVAREAKRWEIRHPTEPWLEQWSLASQRKRDEIRAAAERDATNRAIAASRKRVRVSKEAKAAARKAEVNRMLEE